MKRRIAFITVFLFITAASYVLGDLAQNSVDLSLEYGCVAEHRRLSAPSSDSDEGFQINASPGQKIATIPLLVGESDYKITISSDCIYKHEDDNLSVRPFGIDAVLYLEYEGNSMLFGYGGIGKTDNHTGKYNVDDEIEFTVNSNLPNEFSDMSSDDFYWYTWANPELWLTVMYLRWVYRNSPEMQDKYDGRYEFMLEEYFKKTPTGARLELYLVLPPLTENEKNQMLYANNNEYKSLIHVTGGVQQEIEISGNYTSFINVVSLNIGGNENTKSINLDPSESNPIAYGKNGIDVGTYSYKIETSPGFDVAFDAFLSSSNNPSSNNGAFTLTYLNNDANETSITYEAGISSSNKATKWFDGTLTLATLLKDDSLFNLGSSDFITTGDYVGGGDIMFRLTNDSTQRIDEIPPGTYTSTIYFHVVANL